MRHCRSTGARSTMCFGGWDVIHAGRPGWRSHRILPRTDAALWPQVPGVHLIAQGDGDLGVRMARPLLTLPPGPVVIIGSDIPEVGSSHIMAAFKALGRKDVVFGPAADGGYWLVGARRTPMVPHGLFGTVRWSTKHALTDTLAGLPKSFRVAMLGELDDIDDGAAWAAWRTEPRV